MADKNSKDSLSRNLRVKGIVIPVIFAVIVVLICMLLSNFGLGFLPSGTHDDALTTTATTEKTEFDENEFSRVIQD